MPSGIYFRSEEAKKNIRLSLIGRIPWNKGLTKKDPRVAKYTQGLINWIEINKRSKPNPQLVYANKNRNYTVELREKMRARQKGEKGSNWKGGVSKKNTLIRNSLEGKLWIKAVFIRDNYICQKCNQKGGKFHAHHLLSFAVNPDIRFAIDNGITLCISCHKEFHSKYGLGNNTTEQFKEWNSIK